MSLHELIRPPYWHLYSKKLQAKIESPKFAGFFEEKETEGKEMRLVKVKEGEVHWIILYWLVDESDGIIADCKYQAFGPSSLIGALESVCELILRKNYDQASRISADLIDQHLRDKKHIPAFPVEASSYLNLVISAVDKAAYACRDIPFAATYAATPIDFDPSSSEGIPHWEELSLEAKIGILEEVIDKEIRPYIELDAGGIKLLELKEKEVLISYEGSCTSCHSAAGSTLTAIQQILRSRVHPHLIVVPQL